MNKATPKHVLGDRGAAAVSGATPGASVSGQHGGGKARASARMASPAGAEGWAGGVRSTATEEPAVGQGCRIVSTSAFRVATLNIREDLLVCVRRGRKTMMAAGDPLVCEAGQSLMVARGTRWDVFNDPVGQPRYEALVLTFGESIVKEHQALHGSALASRAVTAAQCLPADEDVLEAMQRATSFLRAKAVSSVVRRHRLLEVLLLLAERGFHFTPIDALTWEDQVRRRVAQRPDVAWTVEALAEGFHCSVSTLRRRLEAEGVGTLAAVVREVRLELALHWLQTSRLPIGEIAQRCGWSSHSRFTAAFQDRWGFAPSVLRSAATVTRVAQDLTQEG